MSTSKDQPRRFGGPSEPYSPRDWSLRTKLLVVLLVPAVLAAILGGLRIADQAGEAAEQNRVSRFVDVQAEVATLVERLQTERLLATSYVAGDRRGDIAPLELAIADVDRTREQTGPSVENLSAEDPALVGASRQSQQALARLPSLRNLVTTSNAPASAVVSRYSELVAQIVQLDNALLRGVNTPEVTGLATGLAGLAVARNEASLQQALLAVVAQTGQLSDPEIAELQSSNARLRTGLVDFRAALDAGQRVRYAGVIAGATNTERDLLVQGVVAGTSGAQASGLYDTFLGELDAAEDGVRTELRETSEATRLTAVSLALINAFLLLLALVIGVAVVGLIARQMIGSLRTLRRGAMDVAERRLPDAVQRMRQGSVPDVNVEPVPVQTREEVGEVARAFDAVHTQAVRLAAEQATLQNNVNAMFVNLSRRSQTLVDRQLKLIEELEAGEEDPDQLSHLFRLDHLATRMRRNSENLLVLAGTELAQRAVRPVPVVEVLQAAVSEVEQYRRIVVSPPPDLAVVGRVGNDLQHLLAELLDNATNFSPPDSRVTMSTSRTDDGTFVVEIVDDGVGLPAAELAQINEQLGLPSDATVEASRRMGLFVVGRLAARHGIEVTLSSGSTAPRPEGVARSTAKPNQGLTALVRVPRLLIHDGFGPARRSGAQRSPATAPRRRDTEATAGQANGVQRTAPPPQPQSSPASAPPAPATPPQPAPPRATQPESRPPSPPRPPGPQPTRPQPPSPPAARPSAQPESRPAPASPVPAGRTPPVGPARTPRSTPPSPGPGEGDGQGRRRPVRAEDAPARAENTPARAENTPARPENTPARAENTPARPENTPARAENPPARAENTPARAENTPDPGAESALTRAAEPTAAGPTPATARTAGSARRPEADRDAPAPARPDEDDPSGLFAPSTPAPALPDPFAMTRPRDPFAAPDVYADSDTPIFSEVASGWFKVPFDLPDTEDRSARPVPEPPAPRSAPPVPASPGATRTRPPTGSSARPGAPPRTPQPVAAGPVAGDFTTAADSGWRAVEAVSDRTDRDNLTGAGLPRRTPRAKLLPGSAQTTGGGGQAPSTRDAESVRGRLASYQRGVREGREGRDDRDDRDDRDGRENRRSDADAPASSSAEET